MSSVRAVPVTTDMDGDTLSADDAWHTARRIGLVALLRDALVRFRFGDGFSHARGFALQLALAIVPLVIAGAGLATAVGAESVAQVVAQTVVAVSPGSGDQLLADVVARGPAELPEETGGDDSRSENVGEFAVAFGLITAFLAMTSAIAQLERGTNRIYGTERDRPFLRKYTRAAVLTLTAGSSLGLGLVLIIAGGPLGDAVEQVYRWGDVAETIFDILRWPVGLAALVVAVTVLFRHSPRRHQPGLSWLALGAGLTVILWLAASGLRGALRRRVRGLQRHLRPARRDHGAAAVGDGHRRRPAPGDRRRRAARGGAGRDRRPSAARRRRRRHPRRAAARAPRRAVG